MYQVPGSSTLNSVLNLLAAPKRASRVSQAKIKNPKTLTPPQLPPLEKIVKIPTQRVFLDLTLDDITNLPEEYSNLEIGFKHSNGITKFKKTCSDEPINLELNKLEYYKPSYRLNVEPSNVENLNKISDEPLVITLYEHIKPKTKLNYWPSGSNEYLDYDSEHGEEEDYEDIEDRLVPLAQGHLDFLQLLTEQNVSISMEAFMYSTNYQLNQLASVKTNWTFKSPAPLLGEKVADIIFMAMESIYNAPLELIEQSHHLGVKLSFEPNNSENSTQFPTTNTDRRSTKSRNSKSLRQDKKEICTFEHFQKATINGQPICLKWESLKDADLDNLLCMGINTPIRIKTLHPYEGLVRTEYVDFQLEKMNLEDDVIIVSNSLHRYLLPLELCQVLEEVIAFKEQHILVEVYNIDTPHIILYDGIIDLSILGFPDVSARRFAIELRPRFKKLSLTRFSKRNTNERFSKKSIESQKATRTRESFDSQENEMPPEVVKPVFIIISICMQTPISETNFSLPHELISVPITENRCTNFTMRTSTNTLNICVRFYQQFDKLITEMAEFIIKRKIKSMHESKDYFCCQLAEVRNILSGIIACEYNTKIPTTTNKEFTYLITQVYNDFEKRLMDLVLKVSKQNEIGTDPTIESEEYLVILNNLSKYARELDLKVLENILNKRIISVFEKNLSTSLEFFRYVYHVETENFLESEVYEMASSDSSNLSAYMPFKLIMRIYTNYRKEKNQFTPGELLSPLLYQILDYAKSTADRIEGWVLLYCYYTRHMYNPGMEFARQKYEDLFGKNPLEMPLLPVSRFSIFNKFIPTGLRTHKMEIFLQVAMNLISLGLYEFAEVVYEQVATELTEPVNYLMKTMLKIMMGELPETFEIQNFLADSHLIDSMEFRAALDHVNGHAEYLLGNKSTAMQYYSRIKDMPLENFQNYKLGLMRYAYECLEVVNYAEATKTFQIFCNNDLSNLDAHFGLSRALYFLNKLEESEKQLAIITTFRVHISDVWAYLALINLRLGRTHKAIQFWKYAKLEPNAIICNEILEDLDKIDDKSLNLFVDKLKDTKEELK